MTPTRELIIVAFGDSTTALRDNLIVYADKIEAGLNDRGFTVKVVNSGIAGNDTDMASARFNQDVLAHNPDVVIIQFGLNDCSIDVWKDPPASEPRVTAERYRANIEEFVDQLQAVGATVILMTPNQQRWSATLKEYYGKAPFDLNDRKSMTHLVGEYAAEVREIAHDKGVDVIDIYQAYDEYEEEFGLDCAKLLLDGSHPNQEGQDLVANRLLDILPGILERKVAA